MATKRRAEGKRYRVLNPLLSVRVTLDKTSPLYNEFLDWPMGSVITEYPPHTAIAEWLAAGHIVEEE